jgi:hypothetical protein
VEKGKSSWLPCGSDMYNANSPIREAARLSGKGCLTLAGKIDFFKNECHLSVGLSLDLARRDFWRENRHETG